MTTPLDRFNSSLLNMTRSYYKGPFYQKLADALRSGAWYQDLGKASAAMFRTSIEQISAPTAQMINNYGQGNIGDDYLINLFVDDRIGRIINILRKTAPQQAPDLERIKTVLSELSFLDRVEAENTLFFRKQIAIAFKNIVNRQFVMHPYIPIKNTEDLSFLGVCSLLNIFIKKQLKDSIPLPRNLFRFLPTTTAKRPWLKNQRYFPIEQALQSEDFASDPLFSTFADYNNRYIAEYTPDLPMSLSSLLSASSFIWDEQLFGMDPMQIQSMSEEQRMNLLMKNKSAIIERCFEYLIPHMTRVSTTIEESFDEHGRNTKTYEDGPFRENLRNGKQQALRLGNQIESTLQEIESNQKLLSRAIRAKNGAKASIREISSSFGEQSDMQFEGELLSLIEKTPIEQAPRAEGLEKLTFDLASRYRRQVLLEAAYKEKITEGTEKLRALKQELADGYQSLAGRYLRKLVRDQSGRNAFLQVHAVFSYFLFNKDVFPQRVGFSQMAKKTAGHKIARLLGKKKRSDRLRRFEPQQPLGLTGTIQEFLTTRSNQIFERFKGYQERGARALSQEEVRSIINISKAIQQKPQDMEKFDRLEKVLEEILVQDFAFLKNCEDLSAGLSSDKVIKLQTHMNACLLFTEGQSASESTGLKRSLGFKKLHQAILRSLRESSIDERAFRSGDRILQQLEAFEYPPQVIRSFGESVRTVFDSINVDQMRDIELNLQPLDIENSPMLKRKKALLDEIKQKIVALAPEGQSAFLSRRHTPTRNWDPSVVVPAVDAVRSLFPGQGNMQTRNQLEDQFGEATFSYGQLINSLQSFVSRENIDMNIFSPGWLRKTMGWLPQSEVSLAVLIGVYEDLLDSYNSDVEREQRLNITQLARRNTPGIPDERASVFDNTTLFRHYKNQKEKFSANQQISEELYEQFLPLFLTSYLADAANLTYGRSFFVQRKLDAIKEVLPGIDRVYGQLDAFLISKGSQLAKLGDFFKEQASQQGFLEAGFLEKVKTMINEIVSGPLALIGEAALTSAILGVGILSYTGSPYLAVIGGMAITTFWMTKGKPFVKDIFLTAREAIRNLFGAGGYSPSSINDYILDLFKVALKTEVKLSQSDRQGELELQHLFSNALFLQEEFSILRNSRYSLFEFKNRLHMLLPNALKNANFSTMLLNLFFKFNESLFLSAPSKLLKNTQHPLFLKALRDYCQDYNQKINEEKQRFLQEGHHDEECDLTPGRLSPFRDYLVQRAQSGELALSFARNSSIHQFLNAQDALLENTLYMPLEESQIVAPGVSPNNLRAFLQTINESLTVEDQFLGAIAPVLQRARRLMTPNLSHIRVFEDGLKSSYFLLRYALDTARRLENLSSSERLSSSADRWLSSTNETGQSIFLSPLFRESFSLLMRTAGLAASSGIREGQEAFRVLVYIQGVVDSYLKRGNLNVIPMERLQELENAIKGLLRESTEAPQIIFPIFIENERNQSIQVPFAVWSFGQEALADEMGSSESALALRDSNSSSIVYLTNQAMELFFTSRDSRGFALSPMVMNILEQALKQNRDNFAVQFLGIMNERDQARLRSLQEPGSFQPNLDQIRDSVSRNMARRSGQPLALMPPKQQGAPVSDMQQPLALQQPQQNQQQPMGNAPQNMQAQPQAMGGGMQGPPMNQPQPQVAQMNQQQEQQMPVGGEPQRPIGVQDQAIQPRQDQQPQQNQMMPLMMGGMQNQPMQPPILGEAPEQQMMNEEAPQQQPVSEPQGRNYVMLGADGSSGSFAGGGGIDDNQPDPMESESRRAFMDRVDANREMPDRPVPGPIGPAPNNPYRGPMNIADFEQYQQQVNQPQGFPYGKAAAIGGGLMLGAALLSQLMKKDDKKRKP